MPMVKKRLSKTRWFELIFPKKKIKVNGKRKTANVSAGLLDTALRRAIVQVRRGVTMWIIR